MLIRLAGFPFNDDRLHVRHFTQDRSPVELTGWFYDARTPEDILFLQSKGFSVVRGKRLMIVHSYETTFVEYRAFTPDRSKC